MKLKTAATKLIRDHLDFEKVSCQVEGPKKPGIDWISKSCDGDDNNGNIDEADDNDNVDDDDHDDDDDGDRQSEQ